MLDEHTGIMAMYGEYSCHLFYYFLDWLISYLSLNACSLVRIILRYRSGKCDENSDFYGYSFSIYFYSLKDYSVIFFMMVYVIKADDFPE